MVCDTVCGSLNSLPTIHVGLTFFLLRHSLALSLFFSNLLNFFSLKAELLAAGRLPSILD